MYLDFFNLAEPPFAICCDERFFFPSPVHNEALASMTYAVQQRKGMVLVTGEVGAGKTFVANMLTARLGPGCRCVRLKNPPQSAKQLHKALASGVGLALPRSLGRQSLLEALEEHLERLCRRGRLVVLVLDEAQDMTPTAMEELRLLWNWELNGQRLVQIVLIGQPELRQKLLEPKWEPLRQRIVLSFHLPHLEADQTRDYIRHRLRVASREEDPAVAFTPQALELIHDAADGIPRLTNVLCDNCLLTCYARQSRTVDADVVNEVIGDMTCWGLTGGQGGTEVESCGLNYR